MEIIFKSKAPNDEKRKKNRPLHVNKQMPSNSVHPGIGVSINKIGSCNDRTITIHNPNVSRHGKDNDIIIRTSTPSKSSPEIFIYEVETDSFLININRLNETVDKFTDALKGQQDLINQDSIGTKIGKLEKEWSRLDRKLNNLETFFESRLNENVEHYTTGNGKIDHNGMDNMSRQILKNLHRITTEEKQLLAETKNKGERAISNCSVEDIEKSHKLLMEQERLLTHMNNILGSKADYDKYSPPRHQQSEFDAIKTEMLELEEMMEDSKMPELEYGSGKRLNVPWEYDEQVPTLNEFGDKLPMLWTEDKTATEKINETIKDKEEKCEFLKKGLKRQYTELRRLLQRAEEKNDMPKETQKIISKICKHMKFMLTFVDLSTSEREIEMLDALAASVLSERKGEPSNFFKDNGLDLFDSYKRVDEAANSGIMINGIKDDMTESRKSVSKTDGNINSNNHQTERQSVSKKFGEEGNKIMKNFKKNSSENDILEQTDTNFQKNVHSEDEPRL